MIDTTYRKRTIPQIVQKYLDEENFLARTKDDAFEEIGFWAPELKEGAVRAFRSGGNASYCSFSRRAGPTAIYDYFKSRVRGFVENVLIKIMRTGILKPGTEVLDVGCGNGLEACFIAEQLKESGFVYGIDSSPGMIKTARLRARDRGLGNTEFSIGDIDELPKDKKYGAVLCLSTLSEVGWTSIDYYGFGGLAFLMSERVKSLREVLKPGGRLFVSSYPQGYEPEEFDRDMRFWLEQAKLRDIQVQRIRTHNPGGEGEFYNVVGSGRSA